MEFLMHESNRGLFRPRMKTFKTGFFIKTLKTLKNV